MESFSSQLKSLIEKINFESFLNSSAQGVNVTSTTSEKQGEVVQQCNDDDGWKDKRQGIVAAEIRQDGSALLKITIKAAGFVVGPKGSCIDLICKQSGASTESWIDNKAVGIANYNFPVRCFFIKGSNKAILKAIQLINSAVARYSNLVSGITKEKLVSEIQIICGIEFIYKPPPVHLIPKAIRTYTTDSAAEKLRYQQTLLALAGSGTVQPHLSASSSSSPCPSPQSPTHYFPPQQHPSLQTFNPINMPVYHYISYAQQTTPIMYIVTNQYAQNDAYDQTYLYNTEANNYAYY